MSKFFRQTRKHCFWQREGLGGGGAGGLLLFGSCSGNPLRVNRVDFGVAPLPRRLPMTGLIPAPRNAVMVTRHIQTGWIDLSLWEFCATGVKIIACGWNWWCYVDRCVSFFLLCKTKCCSLIIKRHFKTKPNSSIITKHRICNKPLPLSNFNL